MKIFSQPEGITKKEKFDLLEKIIGKDKSDKSIMTRLYCQTALPEVTEKRKTWNELMNPKSKLSKKQREQMIQGFHQEGQSEILKEFDDMYYKKLHEVYKNNQYKLFKTFFLYMMPRQGEITDQSIS